MEYFAKTVWDIFFIKQKLSSKKFYGLAIGASILVGLGVLTSVPVVLAGIGAIGMHFQNKKDMIGPDAPGIRSVSSDEDFCNSLWNVFKENEDCGAIINFQKYVLSDRVIFSDMNITSQK